ncbi:MAG TPA: UxaA family hydrolase, partial [Chitinophagaceae bacterium]|nr:UxaA family hydrolase [Chitinophagaceae bacterium]
MKRNVLKVHPKDNVLVALQNLTKGQVVSYYGLDYMLNQNIGAKHKFFEKDMHTGDEIIMYGVLVGKAQHDIAAGSLMTTENTK